MVLREPAGSIASGTAAWSRWSPSSRPSADARNLPIPSHVAILAGQTATLGGRSPRGPAGRFVELVADKLVATEAVFRQHLDSDVPFIHQAGDYIADGGGKRVRPALVLLCARLLGHDGEEEITYGAVVEFIHTATLIHDDIIDHAALRRGQPP